MGVSGVEGGLNDWRSLRNLSDFILLLRKSHIYVQCEDNSMLSSVCQAVILYTVEHAWEVVVGGKMKPNQGILGVFLLVFSHGLAVMSLLSQQDPLISHLQLLFLYLQRGRIHTLSPSPQQTPSSPNPDTLTNTEQKALNRSLHKRTVLHAPWQILKQPN